MPDIVFQPIGIIYTPFHDVKDMPIQPLAAEGVKGHIMIRPEYAMGLKDLDGFSHITLVYHFHKVKKASLKVIPFMDQYERGIFATKSPQRPNQLGISAVKLLRVEKNIIHIEEVDMLNETPLLDIKPFYPRFDNRQTERIGWLTINEDLPVEQLKSDDRFS